MTIRLHVCDRRPVPSLVPESRSSLVTNGGYNSETTGSFRLVRDPRYRVLWLSGVFIFLATHAQQIARGWLAKELTGSNAGIGGVFLGFGTAMLLASLTSGVIADRFRSGMFSWPPRVSSC